MSDEGGRCPRLLVCPEAEADLYLYRRGREAGTVTRVIRGKRCAVLDRCMTEWAAAMQLPYCFEATWESLGQCLNDLTGFEAKTLVILITLANRVLPRARDEFAMMLEVLRAFEQSAKSAGKLAGLELILHAEARDAEQLQARLQAAGVSCVCLKDSQQ